MVLQHLSSVSSHNPNQLVCRIPSIRTTCHQCPPKISLHHLLFFIHSTFIFTITFGVHQETLPLAPLGVPPSIMVFYILWKTSYNYFPLPSHFTPMASTILPTSSNHDKLCYFLAGNLLMPRPHVTWNSPVTRLCALILVPVVASVTIKMILFPSQLHSLLLYMVFLVVLQLLARQLAGAVYQDDQGGHPLGSCNENREYLERWCMDGNSIYHLANIKLPFTSLETVKNTMQCYHGSYTTIMLTRTWSL